MNWWPFSGESIRERNLRLKLEATQRRARQLVRARYDAAQTNSENRKHWLMADGLSARAANSLGVRQVLRNRSRYEAANNSYCAGMLLTLANDMVGTGPRLQLHTGNKKANRFIEKEFNAWSREAKLAQKLRTMRVSRASSGEAVGVMINNPRLPTPVQLDMRTLEADQMTTPALNPRDAYAIDGIRFDRHGNPREYDILPQHPGDDIALPNWQPDVYTADQIIHWFRVDRPGQLRGIPEITPALPLYAQLRRYTLAVIAAAETAAELAGVLEAPAGPRGDGEDDESPEAFAEIDIAYRMLLTTPAGYKLSQMKAEQPTTTYGEFKKEILNEIARCLNMPFNIAAGNSSGYNYSSGRLDHQTYFRAIGIDQFDCGVEILDRLFAAWLAEARLIPGFLPIDVGPAYQVVHKWSWDPSTDLDPLKSAQARLINLQAGMTSYAEEFDQLGLDWEQEQIRQAESLGLPVEKYRVLLQQRLMGLTPAVLAQEQTTFEAQRRMRRRVRGLSRVVASLRKQMGV